MDLDVGQKLVMIEGGPQGSSVRPALKLIKWRDEPVCKIIMGRVSETQIKE